MARPFGTLKYDNVQELDKAIDEYFEICEGKPIRDPNTNTIVLDKNGNPQYVVFPEPPTIEGLAVYLNVDPKTITNYAHKEDYFPTINRARMKILAYNSKRMFDRDGVNGAKFNQINNSERMGGLKYAEKVEQDINIAPITFVDDIGL